MQLLQGGIALIVRRAVFTRFAPQQMPDAWYVAQLGREYTIRLIRLPSVHRKNEIFRSQHVY